LALEMVEGVYWAPPLPSNRKESDEKAFRITVLRLLIFF